jgi:PAP2 superfamily
VTWLRKIRRAQLLGCAWTFLGPVFRVESYIDLHGASAHTNLMVLPTPFVRSILPIVALVVISMAPTRIRAQGAASPPTASDHGAANLDSGGIRPSHLLSLDYAELVGGDTVSILTAPARWDGTQWLEFAGALAVVGGTSAFDRTIRNQVQAHRTHSEDRFMMQAQEFGNYYAFGTLAALDAWGEIEGDIRARNAAMDGISASIIAGGLITPAIKLTFGRERPSTTTSTFKFKPFSSNSSAPSGHTTEAFAVATSIAENYRSWWVQGLAYGTASLVGYARIEQNAHFGSDVVAGALIGWSVAHGVVHRNDGPRDPGKLTWTPYKNGREFGIMFFKSF